MVAGGSGNIADILPYTPDGITLPNGLKIIYNALRNTADGFEYISGAREHRKWRLNPNDTEVSWTRIYGGKVTENIVQALARIVVAEQMVSVGQSYHVAFQVHDEIIIVVPEEEKTKARQLIEERMSTPPSWARQLPVACESGVGINYGDAK